jgi:hypothetical protein
MDNTLPDEKDYDSSNGVARSATRKSSFIMSREKWGFVQASGGFFYKGQWYGLNSVVIVTPLADYYYRITLA